MVRTDVNIGSTYDHYVNSVEEPVSKKDYVHINNLFSKFVAKLIIRGFMVTFPKGMGKVYVAGRKIKKFFDDSGGSKLAPDWGRTRKLWKKSEKARREGKIVRFTNEESNNCIYRVRWSKKRTNVINKNFISLRLTRTNKRQIAKSIKEGKEYIIVK